jgi:pimeloyl-ACP methyl ester carboxylesterase
VRKLVLLPGLDGTGRFLAEFTQAIAPVAAAQLVTYPGDAVLGYSELEVRVRAALPRDEPYVLLAESFSGPIAIRIAAAPPPGLTAVILCVTFAKTPYPALRWARHFVSRVPLRSLPRWLRAPLLWGSMQPKRAPAQKLRAMAGVDARVLQNRLAEVLGVDVLVALPHIRVPALVLEASDDRLVPRSATARLLRGLPTPRHVRIEGPHLLLQSRPAECAAAVAEFLNSVQMPAPA